jgi:tryptophan synthase beta chain
MAAQPALPAGEERMPNADTKILLDESELPTHWYNVVPDLPSPPPPVLHPGTGQPIGPADLAPLFPMAIIMQEVSAEPRIEIPDQVRDIYRLWRPSPLYRARRLEKALDTPAHIYYKYEGVSPAGSHKPNTAVAQAYYNKAEGTRRLTTETGAGQWGSALAFACSLFDLECTVYMVKASYHQKPYRRSMIQAYGATIHASPTSLTNAGRKILAESPDTTGSLGMAISEAVEDAATHDDAHYALGSVLNHVMLHQSVIGLEAMAQMEKAGEYPDVVIGCVGGGSNFAGLAFPFVGENRRKGRTTRIVAAEPTACPTLTKGTYAYDLGDTVGLTPLVKMYTLGHTFVPPAIHAGGLRYHGDAPLVCQLVHEGLVEAVAHPQLRTFEAGVQFARTEGILPAPESNHAIRSAIDEALAAKEAGERRVILFNLSGHGHFDMGAYDAYFAGKLEDYEYPAAEIARALEQLPRVAEPV